MTVLTPAAGIASWSGERPARLFDALSALAAIALVAAAAIMNASSGADGAAAAKNASGAARGPLALAERETVVGAYIGAPYTYPSDVHFQKAGENDFTVRDVTWDAKPFDDPIYYGARVARWFSGGQFGAMADFTHSKALARLAEEKDFTGTLRGAPAPARAVLEKIFHKLEFSHGHNMLTLNGLMRLPFLGARILPYVGAGGGVTLPHTEIHLAKEDARTYEYQLTGFVGQALAGLEFRLPRASVFVEYKFSFAPYRAPLSHRNSQLTLVEDMWLQFKSWLAGETPPGGSAGTILASHQAISGVSVRFQGAGAAAP